MEVWSWELVDTVSIVKAPRLGTLSFVDVGVAAVVGDSGRSACADGSPRVVLCLWMLLFSLES